MQWSPGLAQVPDLKVAGRTSSFAFKGKNEDLRAIGAALGVANVLEGSVQKAGETVRITAQLIAVSDGTHRWSQSYDRKLDDVFRIQDEIASEVVGALRVALQPAARARLTLKRTDDVAAYDEYLQGVALMPRRKVAEMRVAAQHFERRRALDAAAPAGAADTLQSPWVDATAHALLDERDKAIAALARTIASGRFTELHELDADLLQSGLRDDPRYDATVAPARVKAAEQVRLAQAAGLL